MKPKPSGNLDEYQSDKKLHSPNQKGINLNTLQSAGCLPGWYFLDEHCVKVKYITSPSMCNYTVDNCYPHHHAEIDQVLGMKYSTALLAYLDTMLEHSNSNISVSFQSHGSIFLLYPQPYPELKYLISEKWKVMHCAPNIEPSHTLCIQNRTHTTTSCRTNQFQCLDGSCILMSYLCDTHPDCSTSEDEADILCNFVCFDSTLGKALTHDAACRLNCTVGHCICNAESHFQCHQGGCIHFTLLCNRKVDCPNDNSDESFCFNETSLKGTFLCRNGQHVPDQYVLDGQQHCWDGSDETPVLLDLHNNYNAVFRCKDSTGVIPLRFFNDMRPDCEGDDPSDEKLFQGMLNGSIAMKYVCQDPTHEIPCIPGHPCCFSSDKLCVFEKDKDGELLHCRNGEHLLGCDDIVCPNPYIKCNLSYCIPVHAICDGIKDCPDGDDELGCSHGLSCSGMLKCRNATCVHMFKCV